MSATVTADQTASGTCTEGDWTASRFGTLVVVEIAGLATDDTQFADEDVAAAYFADLVSNLSE